MHKSHKNLEINDKKKKESGHRHDYQHEQLLSLSVQTRRNRKETKTKTKHCSNLSITIAKYHQIDVYLLVDLNADSALGDIPDTAGATMVELMRHTLVDGAINLDVDVVSDFVGAKVSGEGYGTLLPEWPRKRVSSTRSQTMTGRHFQLLGFFSRSRLTRDTRNCIQGFIPIFNK